MLDCSVSATLFTGGGCQNGWIDISSNQALAHLNFDRLFISRHLWLWKTRFFQIKHPCPTEGALALCSRSPSNWPAFTRRPAQFKHQHQLVFPSLTQLHTSQYQLEGIIYHNFVSSEHLPHNCTPGSICILFLLLTNLWCRGAVRKKNYPSLLRGKEIGLSSVTFFLHPQLSEANKLFTNCKDSSVLFYTMEVSNSWRSNPQHTTKTMGYCRKKKLHNKFADKAAVRNGKEEWRERGHIFSENHRKIVYLKRNNTLAF